MSTIPTLPGITSRMIDTPRIKMHVLLSGPESGTSVLFIHGNASSATYWEEIMLKLPGEFRGIAIDLRGYGDTEDKPIDASRGLGDWVDDIHGRKDRGSDNPQASPRVVMNSFYWKPPFKPAREEDLLSSLLSEKIGPDKYPGDMTPSTHWPNVAPGKWGPINAVSPKYVGDSVERFIATSPKPSILWVRGSDDQIVSDTSFFDFGTLGKLGFVPGWPGEEVYPPQPMVSQARAVLDKYKADGGAYWEKVIADTGHTPYVEKPDEFVAMLLEHLQSARA